ncbi:MAG: Tryptophan synthase alpha chain (EC [uncultured Campylobacterales bacterium]|uniref:Tryptophan synthase alpha chain n=1 Tax=uncultured Campylobacterales bacterium TaxID=352960 RepID=A0A6S6T5C4_9BACT|nr:MAG: Tryptophan synthase alpha chain (EC [uncultured Campylobacterales bacterium]
MKKLVGYITSGLPSKDFTVDLALSMKENGLDSLELGIPFSDPVADGEVIELANLKVLQNGLKIDDIVDITKQINNKIDTLWMGYFNSFYQRGDVSGKGGFEGFLETAKELKLSGLIIPDLPHEEANKYKEKALKNDVSLIDFIAPTHSEDRIKLITKNSSKFIYLVAYAGITGSDKVQDLTRVIENIRKYTTTDVFLGFGVNENNAKEKSQNVDGVIVGTAFVKILLDDSISNIQKIKQISAMVKQIKQDIN